VLPDVVLPAIQCWTVLTVASGVGGCACGEG
jgi:hypothetical protein